VLSNAEGGLAAATNVRAILLKARSAESCWGMVSTCARRLANVIDTICTAAIWSRDAEKLSLEGEQKMTVQHVHVAEGGQAIVGNVNAPTQGVGERKKSEVQPHALEYAPGVAMPRQIEAERATVPSAGD
jgi:hypothetical protein